ncbi:MAG: hypothetical protein EAZ95_04295 [Bacteroidetes bacterium]|nr:MAG: hypothetical protein EAZ95_04295 [Bacteroidota bacterium]
MFYGRKYLPKNQWQKQIYAFSRIRKNCKPQPRTTFLPGGEVAVRYLPQFLFLAFLAVLYIGNVHYGERMIRETSKMENEVENLRSDYASLKAKYDSYTGKQINIAESAKKLGLQESKGRIQKITIKK